MIDKSKLAFEELEILRHKKLYYNGTPEVSDPEYDILEKHVKQTIPDSPVLNLVGTESDKEVKDPYLIKHNIPMLSLRDVRTVEEMEKWAKDDELFVPAKMDGVAGSLIYVDGKFILAKSRGDGVYGKNITNQFRYIDIPETIDSLGEVEIRGEVVISRSDFDALSEEYGKRGLGEITSIRNIVAGLLNPKKKHHLDLSKYLSFVAYDVIYDRPMGNLLHESNKYDALEHYKFQVPLYSRVTPSNQISVLIEHYKNNKDDYKFLTDGLVFSINNIRDQIKRGFTSHHPKGKLAFKFETDTALTTVLDIETEVTRTGKISFVAIVEPTFLSGATIRRVTLHNISQIESHNVNIGAEIEILRSGEIIPKLIKVTKPNGTYKPSIFCPSCGVILYREGVDLMCNNTLCKGRELKSLIYYCNVLEIENLGDSTIKLLYDNNIVTHPFHLYTLERDMLIGLDGMGDRKIELILRGIADKNQIPLAKAIRSIGIVGIGRKVSDLIVSIAPTIRDISLNLNYGDIISLEGVGKVLTEIIHHNIPRISNYLIKLSGCKGVKIIMPSKQTGSISGKTFVITGKLSKGRKLIVEDIENSGGSTASSVSARVDYLVCNEHSNSSKYRKAAELNIPIITEKELYKLI